MSRLWFVQEGNVRQMGKLGVTSAQVRTLASQPRFKNLIERGLDPSDLTGIRKAHREISKLSETPRLIVRAAIVGVLLKNYWGEPDNQ